MDGGGPALLEATAGCCELANNAAIAAFDNASSFEDMFRFTNVLRRSLLMEEMVAQAIRGRSSRVRVRVFREVLDDASR